MRPGIRPGGLPWRLLRCCSCSGLVGTAHSASSASSGRQQRSQRTSPVPPSHQHWRAHGAVADIVQTTAVHRPCFCLPLPFKMIRSSRAMAVRHGRLALASASSIAQPRLLPSQLRNCCGCYGQQLAVFFRTATPNRWAASASTRLLSTKSGQDAGIITTHELEGLIADAEKSGKQNYILIDVREPYEVIEGRIPTAMHIPVGDLNEALEMPAQTFHTLYGFNKPEKDQLVVFYCRSGVRSTAAVGIAKEHGYQLLKNYRESWLGWNR
ncbi:Rhodanese-like domain-containing protein [Polychytrium aggregatum]|uniref:Rhodanese-like domain-containing protein n=1 Tax=Polychytrium aggregatum TaxID=110093 RepID=UPI0022FE81CA|nr:Rhodanese-like domain-containing protein [Polychytrium aggregatum]KAI9208583.1 Rhodanese-like domain-containing protein [Polychytrium aggregatum]